MGSATSALNSVENEIAARELAKPVDGSDVAHSPTAALEEVKRLRRELRRCLDKEEFKKRKAGNKWRRGSFGQIGKAEDFWDKQDKKDKDTTEEGEDKKVSRAPRTPAAGRKPTLTQHALAGPRRRRRGERGGDASQDERRHVRDARPHAQGDG
jgi:hypothetical protein